MSTSKRIYYNYTWTIIFKIPNRKFNFPIFKLEYFAKNCNYFENFIPYYEMCVRVEDRYMQFFKAYDKELIVYIKCVSNYGEDKLHPNKSEIIFEEEFIPFFDKTKLPTFTTRYRKPSIKDLPTVSYTPENMASLVTHEVKVALLLKRDIDMRGYIHNYILGDVDDGDPVTPGTAAAFIINQNPYIEKFLMDKPDNTIAYPNMIIKANELKDALMQLQINYGIYGKDLLLFYDTGILYVLNKYSHEHAFRKKEFKKVHVKLDLRTDESNPTDDTLISDDKESFLGYERCTVMKVDDKESILSEITGDKLVFSNFDSIINSGFADNGQTTFISPLVDIERPTVGNVNRKTRMIADYDMLNNPFLMTSNFHASHLGIPISFVLQRVKAEDFTPNKNVKVGIVQKEENKLYSGEYNIAAADFLYMNTKEPGERFKTFCSVSLTLTNNHRTHNKDYVPIQK